MSEKIGTLIAQKVARHLKEGHVLLYVHREYCGMDLEYVKRTFLYGQVWDGYLTEVQKEFSSEEEFVAWLAEQDDQSLSGREEEDKFLHDNQRITKNRLISFINSKSLK